MRVNAISVYCFWFYCSIKIYLKIINSKHLIKNFLYNFLYINIYKHIIMYKICPYIFLSLVKLLFDIRKIIIMRKMIKCIIFALFLLQIIKFEEIRENGSYIIIYRSLYVIASNFFLVLQSWLFVKKTLQKLFF